MRSAQANRLHVRSNERCGGPLAQRLTRVLMQELPQRLSNSVVLGENSAINSTPTVNIERLDASGTQSVALIAHTAVVFANGKDRPFIKAVRLQASATKNDVGGKVPAMSAAVGQLAGGIVAQLRNFGLDP